MQLWDSLNTFLPCHCNRYCTEGMFRASNRAEVCPAGSPREAAHLPGAPFHSFMRADAQPLPPGQAVRMRFQLLPTAYRFAKVSGMSSEFSCMW